MSRIRIGVMGCATIAERSVIPAISFLPEEFELIAISSREQEKADKFAHKFDCEAIVGYENLLKRQDIDAIYMPLPTGLHKEWILKSLLEGKHVYAEKSFVMNAQDASELISFATKNKLALMEGFMFQYHSQYGTVKKIINDGMIGGIRSFSASFGFPPLSYDNFRYDKNIGGGALMDAAGYVVRAAFNILGDSLTVKAASMHFVNDSSIFGNAYMEAGDGVGAHLSFGFDNFYQCKCSIWGSKGILTLNKAFTPKPQESPQLVLETETGSQVINIQADNHFIKAFKEFYSIINNVGLREKHYQAILKQSEALSFIDQYSKKYKNEQ